MLKFSKTKFFFGLVLLTFLAGFVYSRFQSSSQGSSLRTTEVVRQDLIQRITISGNVVPRRKTIVAAPFNGYVKKIFVDVGDKVSKNAPLVTVVQSLQSVDPVYPLRSPFAGTVVQILKDEGEFVRQDDSKDFIMRVDTLDELYVLSDVPEMNRTKIRTGQEVIIRASAILERNYKGVVTDIALASKPQEGWRDAAKVEYQARIKILDFDEKLKSGMSTIIDIVIAKKENVLTLPHEYILKSEGKYFALLKSGDKVPITVGLQNESLFEVVSGLNEGQVVKQIDFMELLTNQP